MEASERKNIEQIIIDSIRVLILISKFEYRKSFKLNIDKIMLYDYYMKFPKTMITPTDNQNILSYSFDEYYAFYHWKPNYCDYIKLVKFLLTKGLIDKEIYHNEGVCILSDKGNDLLVNMTSKFKKKMDENADYIRKVLSKESDKRLEAIIFKKYKEGIEWGESLL